MKTPREILLNRHHAAGPKLNAIRQSVVTAVHDRRTWSQEEVQRQPEAAVAAIWRMLWQELILPSRQIWAGLAAVWVVILVVNLAQRDQAAVGGVPSAPMVMSVGEQQRWLNQLFADRMPAADLEQPKTYSPKPRTEITELFTV